MQMNKLYKNQIIKIFVPYQLITLIAFCRKPVALKTKPSTSLKIKKDKFKLNMQVN